MKNFLAKTKYSLLVCLLCLLQGLPTQAQFTYQSKIGSESIGLAQFIQPGSVAVDGSGHIYVADASDHLIRVFSNTGVFIRKFGSFGRGDGQFNGPMGVAVDGSGYIYVADTQNRRIQVFSNNGEFIHKFGSVGSGNGQLVDPHGIAVDGSGKIYVADTNNSRIQVFSNNGEFIRKFGTQGSEDGQFSYPRGIAVDGDGSGKIYVADTQNNRIQVFSNNGDFIHKFGTAGSVAGQFNQPKGIAVDGNGNICVADVLNHRIQVFSNTGGFIRTFGTAGSVNGQFSQPNGIAVDGSGKIYVADTNNSRIQVFFNNGLFILTFGNKGTGDGQFYYPSDVAVDGSGNIYLADRYNNRIQVFSNTGVLIRKFGTSGIGDGQLWYPLGIALDGNRNIYIADSFSRIQVFSNNGVFIRKFGTFGYGNGQFNGLWRIAVDGSGKIYVTEMNNRVQVFSSDGTFITKFGTYGTGDGQFSSPWGIAVDGSGHIYVADGSNHRIQVFSNTGVFIRTFGTRGTGFGTGDGQLSNPNGIAVDGSGNIYVVDANNRVQVFSNNGTFITKFGTYGTGDEEFNRPQAIALDAPRQRVIISDTWNHHLKIWTGDINPLAINAVVTHIDAPCPLTSPDNYAEGKIALTVSPALPTGQSYTYTWSQYNSTTNAYELLVPTTASLENLKIGKYKVVVKNTTTNKEVSRIYQVNRPVRWETPTQISKNISTKVDDFVEFVVNPNNQETYWLGFTDKPSPSASADINYGVKMVGNSSSQSSIEIYEQNVSKATYLVGIGDVIRMVRTASTIDYYINDVKMVYASALTITNAALKIYKYGTTTTNVGANFCDPCNGDNNYNSSLSSNWYFGKGVGLKFSANAPSVIANVAADFDAIEGSASVSDINDVPLFYTNGEKLYKADGTVIKSDLGGSRSATQSSLFVPKPGSSDTYYLFVMGCEQCISPNVGVHCYEVNTNGSVSSSPTSVSANGERITAIKKPNVDEYWIISTTGAYISATLLNNTGFSSTLTFFALQNILPNESHPYGQIGYLKASPDGSKLALVYQDRVFIFNFSVTTGAISNQITIDNLPFAYGLAFSADNNYLYVSTRGILSQIHQIDLESNTRTWVSNVANSQVGALQIEPDNHIYVAKWNSKYLGRITGASSASPSYEENAVLLGEGKFSRLGLPNMIHTRCRED
jgi:tripartite motif-containing protein 71